MNGQHTAQGFTLTELLIAVACIALMAGFAWPSYQHLLLRGQRAQARASLLQAAHWMERAANANVSYPSASQVPNSVLQVEGLRYTLAVSSTAQSYTLTATPWGTQAADPCGALTLNQEGLRGVQGAHETAAKCWSQ